MTRDFPSRLNAAGACYTPTPTGHLVVQGTWGLQGHSTFCTALCSHNVSVNEGVGRTLVVRVCVVAPPVALCGTHRGRLVAGGVTGDRGPPIGGVCVMPLLSVMGVGGLTLCLCSPPWMAVMGSGSTLTMVWWIMMMVVLSPPEEWKGKQSMTGSSRGSGELLWFRGGSGYLSSSVLLMSTNQKQRPVLIRIAFTDASCRKWIFASCDFQILVLKVSLYASYYCAPWMKTSHFHKTASGQRVPKTKCCNKPLWLSP